VPQIFQSKMIHRGSRIFLATTALSILGAFPGEAAKERKNRKVPSLGDVFQPAQMKQDLAVLREALEKGHPGLYLFTAKADFDKKFEQANQAFDRPMTLREFYLEVAPLVEKVYCGHTYFDLPPKLLKSLGKEPPLFPLPLVFLNKKAYVDHAKTEVPLGAEIIAINGTPMDEVLAELLPYIRSDGYNVTLKYRQMDDEFALHHFLLFGPKEVFEVEYLPFGSNKKMVKAVQAIPAKKLANALAERHSGPGNFKKYTMREVNTGISLIRMNTFDFGLNKKGRQKYKTFLQENFGALQENKEAKVVILDLRQNDGGYVGNDAQLFSYFAQAPFRDAASAEVKSLKIAAKEHLARDQFPKMLERILAKEFKRHDSGRLLMIDEKIRRWEPKKKAFRGQLLVLIGGWTHSGGVVFGSYLLNNDNVTFIGEETGGGHDTFTAGNMVLYDLPNTQCQLEVPLIRYENFKGERAFLKGSGIRPDHSVQQTPADLINKVDTVMEFGLELARKKISAEKTSIKK
jgi:hypothetical protein